MQRRGMDAVQITRESVAANPDIYKQIRGGRYKIVYAAPEMIVADEARFTKKVMGVKNCSFVENLVCIAIDEAHVAWSWQSFRGEYCHLAVLRSCCPAVPFLLLSATLALNVLGFLHSLLHLRNKTRIYRILIDRPNITHIVSPIRSPQFTALSWLVGAEMAAHEIPKTMIFADSINKSQDLVDDLRDRLPMHLRAYNRAKVVIRPYNASLT